MTEEELEQKAEEYEIDCVADIFKGDVCELQYAYSAQKLEQAYKDGYEQGQKEIEELKAQIEKMKNCVNCKLFKKCIATENIDLNYCDLQVRRCKDYSTK